jgi:hypothetical protein
MNGKAKPKPYDSLMLKLVSLRKRAQLLTKLRETLSLKPEQDISEQQWEVLHSQLSAMSNKIIADVRTAADRYISDRFNLHNGRLTANRVGELEIELTGAYGFYDTYMDILTQRLSDEIGPRLRGCDVIAATALRLGNIGDITVAPLVYCERGFGASTLREGVSLSRGMANPIPFIAIPYSRIADKYNLISIFHEVGHQALMKLDMVGLWQAVFYDALKRAGARDAICKLYARWSKEVVPDFWAFCLSGMAQTCSIRDVLTLPYNMMFGISSVQPHPPSYLRFLFSVQCCRECWGNGDWNDWELEWTSLYPLNALHPSSRNLIAEAKKYIPTMAKAMIHTRFRKLGRKTLPSMFHMDSLAPSSLKKMCSIESIDTAQFARSSIGVQLAAFRLMREKNTITQRDIDVRMDTWLQKIGRSAGKAQ